MERETKTVVERVEYKECLCCGRLKSQRSYYVTDFDQEICRTCYKGYEDWMRWGEKAYRKRAQAVKEQFSLDIE